jgi:hypothetical protein
VIAMSHGKDIDSKVAELVRMHDKELVDLALKYLKTDLSQISNSLVESLCNKFKPGDVLTRDQKTIIAIYVAFEELARNK